MIKETQQDLDAIARKEDVELSIRECETCGHLIEPADIRDCDYCNQDSCRHCVVSLGEVTGHKRCLGQRVEVDR